MATPPRAAPNADTIRAIREAPAEVTTTALGKQFGLTPQYVGRIRRGAVMPAVATVPAAEVEAKVLEIAGDGGITAKRARAVEMLFDAILLELDDIKRQERTDQRGKRLSVAARALRDASECAAQLRRSSVLEAMTDDEVRQALAVVPEAKG